MATAGKTLRRERRLAELSTVEVAARMGISRTSLWVIERSAEVDPVRVKQYRAALARGRDATETSGSAA